MLNCSWARKGVKDLNHFTFIRFIHLHKFFALSSRTKRTEKCMILLACRRESVSAHKFCIFSNAKHAIEWGGQRASERMRETVAPCTYTPCMLPFHYRLTRSPMHKWNRIPQTQRIHRGLCHGYFYFSDFHIWICFSFNLAFCFFFRWGEWHHTQLPLA